MDQIWMAFFAITLSILFFIFKKSILQPKKHGKTPPPSPPSLPIIGHLHLLKNPKIHRSFQQISLHYGSIFSLNLGIFPCIVISSPSAVEECFTKNDVILANRPRVLVGKHLHYEWTTLGAAPYGPLWLNLRRLTTQELFSANRMQSFACIRLEEVRSLVKGLFGSNKQDFVKVEMASKFSGLSLNILTRMLTGKRYYFSENETDNNDDENMNNQEEGKKFIGIMREVFEISGVSNLVDCFPILRWFNIERKMVAIKNKMDTFLNHLIEECRKNKNGCEANETAFIYKLLNLQELEPANYSDQIIKGIIMTMLIAGTDTSAITIEWALSLLLNHPNVLHKAREEIDNHKANTNELVQEVDLPKLPYIQCIINETLRLFPAAPLLVGHTPSEDITISGYHIDKGKTILINAWAIHRDPNLWKDDHLKFRPERFEELKYDEHRFNFIPFGLGRRSCPGANLANRVIGLTLATLIQCFDWKRVSEEKVDLSEGVGLTMPKVVPLEAMCKPRRSMIGVMANM
ncbi:Isoflavone 2'-hydroxylase [Bienertia sinuspersici]